MELLRLAGLRRICLQRFDDERGFFLESYRDSRYEDLHTPFVQDNLAFSRKGVVRGLHFQAPPGQAKLVSVIHGRIWDVAVDCRPDSPTFGQWEALELTNGIQFFIPAGFAHGYCALEDSYVQYKVGTVYDPATERSIRWNDPHLQVAWPVTDPIVSQRDQTSPFFHEVFSCTSG